MAVDTSGTGSNNQKQEAIVSGNARTSPDRALHEKIAIERVHVKLLTEAIASALDERTRLERTIVSGIEQQGLLYDKLFLLHRQVAAATAKRNPPPTQQANQGQTQSKASVDAPPSGTTDKSPTLNTGLHHASHDAQPQGTAALPVFESPQPRIAPRVSLSNKAKDVSLPGQTAIQTTEKDKEVDAAQALNDGAAVPSNAVTKRASRGPTMERDSHALERDRDSSVGNASSGSEQLELNGIEQVIERKEGKRATQVKRRRITPQEGEVNQPRTVPAPAPSANQVASDEVFTASKHEAKPIVPAEVEDKYVRVGTKYYHPHNTKLVAFEDKGNKLETRSNSEQIAGAMVTIARARGWDEIRVSGSETFRRQVWLEAATHGMQVKGYKPSAADKAELAKRGKQLDVNRVEPDSDIREHAHQPNDVSPPTATLRKTRTLQQRTADGTTDEPSDQQPTSEDRQRGKAFAKKSAAEVIADHPELAGAYAALASMQKKVAADGLSAQERAVAMARIEANLVNSIERGQLPTLKIREQVNVQRDPIENRQVTR